MYFVLLLGNTLTSSGADTELTCIWIVVIVLLVAFLLWLAMGGVATLPLE